MFAPWFSGVRETPVTAIRRVARNSWAAWAIFITASSRCVSLCHLHGTPADHPPRRAGRPQQRRPRARSGRDSAARRRWGWWRLACGHGVRRAAGGPDPRPPGRGARRREEDVRGPGLPAGWSPERVGERPGRDARAGRPGRLRRAARGAGGRAHADGQPSADGRLDPRRARGARRRRGPGALGRPRCLLRPVAPAEGLSGLGCTTVRWVGYDVIVVGGGSAGGVLAARLSE